MPFPVPPSRYQTKVRFFHEGAVHDGTIYSAPSHRPGVLTMERKLMITECIKYQKIVYHPSKKSDFVPESGSEIFVKSIPIDATDVELVEFFGTVGEIFQLRLMMAENGIENRGFCYVSYMNPDEAKKAIDTFKCKAFRPNVFLQVEPSLNNCRIFIGGIPTFKTKDQIWHELGKNGVTNIVDVITYRSYSNRAENRGFVFVEFKSHEQAANFRARHADSLKLFGSQVIVDWSVPIPEIEPSILEAVKIIYMRNLDVTDPPEKLEALLLQFVDRKCLEKVYKFKNYAFVHLTTRKEAENLMRLLKDHFKNTHVEIEWAKPPNKYTVPEYRQQKVRGVSKSRSRTCSSSSNISQKSEGGTPPRECTTPKPFRRSSESQQELQNLTSSFGEVQPFSRKTEGKRFESRSHFMNCPDYHRASSESTHNPLCHQIPPRICCPHSFPRPTSCPAGSSLCSGTHCNETRLTRPLCIHTGCSVNDNPGPSSYRWPHSISLPSTRIHQLLDSHPAAMGTSHEYDPIEEYQRRMAELYGNVFRNDMPRTLSDSD